MTTISNPINLPHQPVPWTNARNWAANPTATPTALTGKNTASIAPQNTVEPTWRDALDAINPLHQIPVVGEIYRGLTGEKISGIARVAGGFIFGGIAGGLAAAMVAAYAEGHDDQGPGEQLVAALANDKGASVAAPTAAPPGAAQATIAAAKSGTTGLPPDDIPTVTITAQDAANLQLPSQPVFARQPAPETAAELTRNAQRALTTDGGAPVAAPENIVPGAYTPPPLRDKLNAKRPTPGFSATPRPLNLSSFIDRLPAQAANLSLNQPDNLALLQGVNALPNPAGTVATATADVAKSAAAPAAASGRNPLPPELVRDMMLQALDKYQQLPAVVPESAEATE